MPSKTLVFLGMTVGSIVGGYVPMIFGEGAFSFWSIIGSAVGGALGIYIGYRLSDF